MARNELIDVRNFIIATRDSGYKTTASALAELVDNAIEACATYIDIQIKKQVNSLDGQFEVIISDDGHGMNEDQLNLCLQFGGSTRFNSRLNLGRYGMGLPNSSLSQCRRVEVFTWKDTTDYLSVYLDVDEIIRDNLTYLKPIKTSKTIPYPPNSKSGTIIIWKKCDRLSFKYLRSLVKHIQFELGRIFRYAIWRGVQIKIDDEEVLPFDPMFLRKGLNLLGAVQYGKELNYEIRVPGQGNKKSMVKVRFAELPVKLWSKLSNEDKRKNQITKCAGVSVLRSEREIDTGWFFFGDKRKENYDDWWRCEISFHPDLDEAFGVTHTKQEIKQTEFLNNILVPDLEQIARSLNNRIRLEFVELKKTYPLTYSKGQLERTDVYQPALNRSSKKLEKIVSESNAKGFRYEITTKQIDENIFFDIERVHDSIILVINTEHLFYDKVFKALHDRKINNVTEFIKVMELLIFAAARSELSFKSRGHGKIIGDFRREWGAQLKTFIS